MLFLFFLGIPVAFSILLSSFFYILINDINISTLVIPQRMIFGINSFPLMAVPFFILAGELMNSSGITERIFNFCQALVGHIKGGLAHVNVLASMLMSGMSGSSVADASGLGKIEIKAMKENNFDADFSAAITAASATIGPIIPPSIPAVIYAVAADVSVGKVLLAGLLPGIIMGISLMIVAYIISIRRNYSVYSNISIKRIFYSFKRAFFPLLTPIILIGGILSGIFTPTEAASVASAYALIISIFLLRKTDIISLSKRIFHIFIDAGITTSTILILLSVSSVLSTIILREQIPQEFTVYLLSLTNNPYVILLLLNFMLLLLGCFFDGLPLIVMLTPILLPIIVKLGIDPVHFGIVMILNLMIGLITPPYGVNMFITCDIAKINTHQFVKAIFPFFLVLVGVLLITTFYSDLTMFIPNILIK
jgi:tripartite ATP-independent transporter DctM subunit